MSCIRLSATAAVTPTAAGVMLRSDLGTFQVTGPDLAAFVDRMLPLLDGSRDREALVQALAGYSRASVTAFLDLLEARGLVEPVPEAASRLRGQEAFFRGWPAAPPDAMARLARARVVVAGVAPWGAAAAIELAASGVSSCHVIADPEEALDLAATAPPGERLLVAVVPPEDAARVERLARLAHRAGVVSLWSHLTGTTAVLGPLVTPGRTACRICADAGGLNPPLTRDAAPGALGETMARLVGHLVALEAIRVVSGYAESALGGRVRIEDLRTQEASLHALVRLPWCRVCGEA